MTKYLSEFRDPRLARGLLAEIARHSRRTACFMEFCGGHTHAISKAGLRQLLPATVQLRSGPGCPVCVTSATDLERALILARLPEITLVTFGDMLRVPGVSGSLQEARADGADVRMIYSTLDALQIARQNPKRKVILLAVGFETTAPTTAAALLQAEEEGIHNFWVYNLHKLTPPAMRAILDAGEVRLQGIIGPGHVTTIIGADAWRFLPQEYGISCVVAGFEPLDILRAVAVLVRLDAEGRPEVYNAYGRIVQAQGNPTAQRIQARVFAIGEAEWRGFGVIPASGLVLRPEFAHRDAARVFQVDVPQAQEPAGCSCGEVLRGVLAPPDCPLYANVCSPRNPVGPCMVSSEGACAAYYRYGEMA
jgi:hydrogenase expression/formation protein HypD